MQKNLSATAKQRYNGVRGFYALMTRQDSSSQSRLTAMAKTGGCGCKIAPQRLFAMLQNAGLHSVAPPELLADSANAEDAAVWKIGDDCAMIASADFFAPPVDSPRDFGRIAAANALSDIYAMGGRPLFALSLLAMPEEAADDDIAKVLRGGAEQCNKAGAVIAGGHSIASAELLYGLAVVGQANPNCILYNGGAKIGDDLIAGKPLGVGLMSAAHRRGELSAADSQQMTECMLALNCAGMELAKMPGAHAMTDITGFGLLGHLSEMRRASKCGARINVSSLPIFPQAISLAKTGASTGASARNWQSVCEDIAGASLEEWQKTILTDPQTGGGLLLSCAKESTPQALDIFRRNGNLQAARVGEIIPGNQITIAD